MVFLKAVGQGLAFVTVVMLAIALTVWFGIIGVLLAVLMFGGIAAFAFSRRSPHDEQTEKRGHDWYEV